MLETQYDTMGRRFYVSDTTKLIFPSVTTVLSSSTPFQSRGPTAATQIGELVHYHILKDMTDEILPFPDVRFWNMTFDAVNEKIENGLEMWRKLDIKAETIAVEVLGCNYDPLYAGRIDWLCNYDGLKTVFDIKTGNYYSHYKMQLAAYMHMVNADQGGLIQLDLNKERNPEVEPKVKLYSKEDLEESLIKFFNTARKFK